MDGTNAISQCGIPPGETMTYNFTLEDWVGTSWYQYVPVFNTELGSNKFDSCAFEQRSLEYHVQVRPRVTSSFELSRYLDCHCSDGLVGPMVVHSPNESVPSSDQDLIVQLSDIYNTWSPTLLSGYLSVRDLEVSPIFVLMFVLLWPEQ